MPNILNAQGLTTATQTELLTYFTNSLRSIYGSTVNVSSNTPDGQWINIFIQAVLDLEDLVTQIYNSFNPDNAIGIVLDQRVAINGIQRQGGTYSQTFVTITISGSVNLFGIDQSTQPIYTVSDASGNQWQLVTSVSGAVTGSFLFQAAVQGAVQTTPNTITLPVTIILGVTAVNNPAAQIITGINAETDAVLKVRRQKSTAIQSQGFLQGLLGALLNINGITSAIVHENDGSGSDNTGTPGHSIWVTVAGSVSIPLTLAYNSLTIYSYGQIASFGGFNYISVANNNLGNLVSNPLFWQLYNPIAEAIYNYRNAGCGMYNSGDAGAQSYAITQIDGSSFNVYWDTVIAINPFLKMTVASLNRVNTPNITAIIESLTNTTPVGVTAFPYVPGVGQEININQLSTLVDLADPNTLATFPSGYGFSSSVMGTYSPFLYTNGTATAPNTINKQFSIIASNIIALPIALNCPSGTPAFDTNNQQDGLAVSINRNLTIQFVAAGGYGTLTWSVSGSGSINSSTGFYTAGSSAGSATVTVTDTESNTQTATVTVN